MNMVKRTWAEISLNAIEHNYNVIRNKVADDTKVCCVIKADGYGHGAVELSQVYEKLGADFFAVSNIDEGIEIRKSGSKLPIVILGYTPVSEAENLAEYDISQAVFHLSMQRSFLKNVLKRIVSAKCTSRLTRECQESALCVRNFHGMNILLKKFARLVAFRILRLRGFLLIFVCLMKMPRAESSQTSSMKTLFMCVTALKSEALI